MLDSEIKQKLNTLINKGFLINVFSVNEDEDKPTITLNNKLKDGNIFNYIKTYNMIVQNYYPKNIKVEQSLKKVIERNVSKDNIGDKYLYVSNVFTKEKSEKSKYQLILSEMSKYVNFEIEIDNEIFEKLSGHSYSDLSEDKLAKNLLKNMKVNFLINLNSNVGLRILNNAGDLDYFNNIFDDDESKQVCLIKKKEKDLQNNNKKYNKYIINDISL